MSENPMSSLRIRRMLGRSDALPPFAMVFGPSWVSGVLPRQADAEAEIVGQVHGAQQFQRPPLGAEREALDRQQGAAGLDAQQFRTGGIRQRRADGLLCLLDGMAELFLEHAIQDRKSTRLNSSHS